MPAGVVSERASADRSKTVSLRDGSFGFIKITELSGRLQHFYAMLRLYSKRMLTAMILMLRVL